MKVLDRKYAKEVKEVIETEGFVSYHKVAVRVKDVLKLDKVPSGIRTLVKALETAGEVDTKKVELEVKEKEVLTMKEACEKYGVKKLTGRVTRELDEAGFTKVKAPEFPYAVTFERLV